MVNGESAKIINKSKSGIVCNAGDAEKLSKNIIDMAKLDKKTLNNMGFLGKDFAKKEYNREILINKLENEFYNLISHNQ